MLNGTPPWEAIPRFFIGDWWKDEELPMAFEKKFESASTAVEIGFGRGEFILEMAKSDKNGFYVGIEHYGEGLRKLAAELKRENVVNCLPIAGDGYVVLNFVFQDNSLSDIFVNFPDPWPKEKHRNRRLFTGEFFSLCAEKLKPGGVLHLATDHQPLALQAVEESRTVAALKNRYPQSGFTGRSPYEFQTRYEQKWVSEKRALYYFEFERI